MSCGNGCSNKISNFNTNMITPMMDVIKSGLSYPEYIDKQLTSLSKIRVPSEVEKKLIFLYKTQKLS